MLKFLLIFQAALPTHIAEVVREVDVNSMDELRGEIELRGEEISQSRGVVFRCDGVEEVEEDA